MDAPQGSVSVSVSSPAFRAMSVISPLVLTGDDQAAALGVDVGETALLQRQALRSQAAQRAEKVQQRGILASPGERAPVQRVFKALHSGLVAVEQCGRAGEAVQQHPGQPQLGPPRASWAGERA